MRLSIRVILRACLALVIFPRAACAADEGQPRYVSLAPSTTEILCALGLDEQLVGVSTYCNYPQRAASKEKVGDFSRPNIERIIALRPDYIFCTGLEQDPAVDRLRRLRIPVYIADPADLEGLMKTILDIGGITGRKTEAERLVREMRGRIDAVGRVFRDVPPEKRPKVFVEIWDSPLMTAGRGSYIDELIVAAGGSNIAYDTIRPYSIFSPETVLRRDPDCIIMAYMDGVPTADRLKGRAGWDRLSAVKNGHVHGGISADILLRPGPRVANAIEELNRVLYDERSAL